MMRGRWVIYGALCLCGMAARPADTTSVNELLNKTGNGTAVTAAAPVEEKILGLPLVIHFHTIFSDGDRSPERVKERLAKQAMGVIITDHHSDDSGIVSKTQQVLLSKNKAYVKRDKPESAYGYNTYLTRITTLTNTQDPYFLAIPGVEVGVDLLAKGREVKESHLLLLDITNEMIRTLITRNGYSVAVRPRKEIESANQGEEEVGTQAPAEPAKDGQITALEDLLSLAAELHVPSVAAHPVNPVYPFPLDQTGCQPKLIEFFNTGVLDKSINKLRDTVLGKFTWEKTEAKTRDLYLTTLRQIPLGVTAGADFHTNLSNKIDDKLVATDQWQRYTYICGVGDHPSQAQVLEALYNGQTYAAVGEAALLEISPDFGLTQPHKMNTAALGVKLTAPAKKGRTLYLYRVGAEGVKTLNRWNWKGDSFTISYTDTTTQHGQTYSYVWYIPRQLITSPIRIAVR